MTRFVQLPEEFEREARRHGYAHFGRGETINLVEYSCPHCGAADRERLAALYLDEVVTAPGFVRGGRLVHFAPEPALAARLRRLGAFEVRTADLLMEGVDDRVDITAMAAYPDANCDAFICSHVLEHVPDDAAALRELRRILRPGGWGIILVPLMTHFERSVEDPSALSEADRWRLFGQGDHVRLYAKLDFLQRLATAGFQVRQLGATHFGRATFERCGITPGSVLYVVSP
ncbi:MAG: methyltransferase domain-containing protein [Pseudomonadota bacterium]